MNADVPAGDVLQNTLVGGRFAPDIVVLRKPVHGNSHGDVFESGPLHRYRNHGAGDYDGVDSAGAKLREHFTQFPMADQRLAADQRDVERLVLVDDAEDPFDQFVAATIANLTQGNQTTQMVAAIGVASGTAERTFFCDFYGREEERDLARPFPTI